MGKLRRRELIPEDTVVKAVLAEAKIVHGQFGRQVEAKVRITEGEHRGTEFKNWFSFAIDKDDNEEYIPLGGPLYQALAMVRPDIDEVLHDENLTEKTEKKYQTFIKDAVKKLDGFAITGRVGIKEPKNNPEKKRNFLQPGSFGPVVDPEADFDEIDMEKAPL